jgi:Toastrack DUF4097
MKKLFQSILLICTAVIAHSQGTLYLTKSLAGESLDFVNARTSGGSIDAWGGHSHDARIEIYVSSNGHVKNLSKDEIQNRITSDYDLTVAVADHKLTVSAQPKKRITNWKRSLNISFKIYIPENISTDLSTSGGSISLTDLSGTEDFRTSGGSLTVERLSGKVKGLTSGGSIHVLDSKDDIVLVTSGGSIDAGNCDGKLQLTTSGGSLHLDNLTGEINASTSGGSIKGKRIGGELVAATSGGSIDLQDLACSLKASTSGGNINAQLDDVGKYVELNNSGGHINLTIPKDKGYDLKLYGNKMNRNFSLSHFSGTVKDDRIEGTINGGGIPVTAHAGGGKIYLSFK